MPQRCLHPRLTTPRRGSRARQTGRQTGRQTHAHTFCRRPHPPLLPSALGSPAGRQRQAAAAARVPAHPGRPRAGRPALRQPVLPIGGRAGQHALLQRRGGPAECAARRWRDVHAGMRELRGGPAVPMVPQSHARRCAPPKRPAVVFTCSFVHCKCLVLAVCAWCRLERWCTDTSLFSSGRSAAAQSAPPARGSPRRRPPACPAPASAPTACPLRRGWGTAPCCSTAGGARAAPRTAHRKTAQSPWETPPRSGGGWLHAWSALCPCTNPEEPGPRGSFTHWLPAGGGRPRLRRARGRQRGRKRRPRLGAPPASAPHTHRILSPLALPRGRCCSVPGVTLKLQQASCRVGVAEL